MRRSRPGEDVGSRFGKGRPWAERTTLQRVSLVLDIVVITVVSALVLGTLWLIFFGWR